jgi:hypothetical protein
MNMRKIAIPLLVALVAAGCPRNGDREVAPDTVGLAPPDDPAAMPEVAQTVELVPLAGEPVRAESVLLPIGTQTQVTVHVHQGPANTSLTAHVITGRCDAPGPLVADLQPVVTDAAGQGMSQIAVDFDADVLANGNHLVQLRRGNGREGMPVACGEIPALSGAASPPAVPATRSGEGRAPGNDRSEAGR